MTSSFSSLKFLKIYRIRHGQSYYKNLERANGIGFLCVKSSLLCPVSRSTSNHVSRCH